MKEKLFIWDLSEKSLKSRMIFLLIIFISAFLIIFFRILTLSLSTANYNLFSAKDDYFRRDIVDRNGVLLAINVSNFSA